MTPRSIRILIDRANSQPPYPPLDNVTDSAPTVWRGEYVSIEVGVFADFAAGTVEDVTTWTQARLKVFRSQTNLGTALLSKTFGSIAGDLDPSTMDLASWNDGSKETAVFDLTATDTDIDTQGAASRSLWLVLEFTDGSDTLVLAAGELVVHEPGL